MLPGYKVSPGPGCLHLPGAGPRGTLGLPGGWHSVQGTEKGPGPAPSQRWGELPGHSERAYLTSSVNSRLVTLYPSTSRVPVKYQMKQFPSPQEGGPSLSALESVPPQTSALGAGWCLSGRRQEDRDFYKWVKLYVFSAACFIPLTCRCVGHSKAADTQGFISTALRCFIA